METRERLGNGVTLIKVKSDTGLERIRSFSPETRKRVQEQYKKEHPSNEKEVKKAYENFMGELELYMELKG